MTAVQRAWLDQFEEFAARKTWLATTLALPPYLTQLDNHEENALAVGNAWTTRLFDGPFYLSTAARDYGLTNGTRNTETIELTDLADR